MELFRASLDGIIEALPKVSKAAKADPDVKEETKTVKEPIFKPITKSALT